MSLRIVPFDSAQVSAVAAFNERLARGGVEFRFPTTPQSVDFPAGGVIEQQAFVAVDDQEVRGGYLLKTEKFQGEGHQLQTVGNYGLPLSEGIVDKRHAMVGVSLLWDALARSPKLYCLGMGGTQRPLPLMLARLKWKVETVPFYFRVLRASGFARHLRYGSERWRKSLRWLEACGLLWLGVKLWCWTAWLLGSGANTQAEAIARFGPECEDLPGRALRDASCAADRSPAALNLKFPPSDERFTRLVIRSQGVVLGWAVLSVSQLSEHKQFGNMRLGALVDQICLPGFEGALLSHALEVFARNEVDLIVSNQTHRRWQKALSRALFAQGPSNFALARSPAFSAWSGPLESTHFTRGDGDGPINL